MERRRNVWVAEANSRCKLRRLPRQVKSRTFLIRAETKFFPIRLEHLKRQCEPHLVETVKGSVEALCTKVYTLSVEHVKKIRERHVLLLKENGLNDPMPAVPPGHRKEEICTPIQFALPPIRLPVVDYQFERDHINVKYTHPTVQTPDTHTLNMTHLQKLVSLIEGEDRCS